LSYNIISDAKDPKISMITECFLGSAVVGLVHFLKTNDAKAKQQVESDQQVRMLGFAFL
jgi:hypothetical protein